MPSVLASILRLAALDVVDDVREELDETAEPFGGGLLKEIARLTQAKDQVESDLGDLLDKAADRGFPWTIISEVSGVTRQALSVRYRS
jgi:hypothetical protein